MAVCHHGNRQLKARETGGPSDRQIREAVRFVETYLRVAAYQAPHRVEIPQYSVHAVFEAVVNAVAQRDYAAFGASIRLFMFDGRLELNSPGNLSGSMSPDDLRTNQYRRNEFLFSRLGPCYVGYVPGANGRQYFVERRGEGIPIFEDETFALCGQRPSVELISGRELKITLPAARPPVIDGSVASVKVCHDFTGNPLPKVPVSALFPNTSPKSRG